jgi:nicotinamidase-related amidase
MGDALLIIDVQRNMFEPDPVHDAATLLARLTTLVDNARRQQIPVVFIRNNGGDDDPDKPGTPGWEIDPRVGPGAGEPVIDKWQSNSFAGTDLKDVLDRHGVDAVIIAGLQSEFCVYATCEGATEVGLNTIVVSDAHSTFDGEQPAAATIADVNAQCQKVADLLTTAEVVARW